MKLKDAYSLEEKLWQIRQHIKKLRHYFADYGPSSQGYVFSWMYGCESWTVKKVEHWRTDAFELWYWRRLLRIPWTARKSNQSILKEISPEYSLEELMLKLKLQYLGHLMPRADSLEKTLMLLKAVEGWRQEEKGMTEDEIVGWHHRLNGHGFGCTLGVGEGQGGLACCDSWSCRVGHDWATELNWMHIS